MPSHLNQMWSLFVQYFPNLVEIYSGSFPGGTLYGLYIWIWIILLRIFPTFSGWHFMRTTRAFHLRRLVRSEALRADKTQRPFHRNSNICVQFIHPYIRKRRCKLAIPILCSFIYTLRTMNVRLMRVAGCCWCRRLTTRHFNGVGSECVCVLCCVSAHL